MPMRIVRAGVRNPWTTIVLAVIAGLGGYSISQALEPEPWDPLGEYPVQTILNRVPGVEGPAARVGEPVQVVAIKCNTLDTPVLVAGRFQWQSQTPGGYIGGVAEGTGTREPGCEKREFTNPPPPEVIQQMRKALSDTNAPVVWAINGQESPVAVVHPDGSSHTVGDGVSRDWTTENITIVPADYKPMEAR